MPKYVYVVGFTPAVDSGLSAGGFDWFHKFKKAVKCLKGYIGEGEGYNLTLTKVRIDTWLPDPVAIQQFLENNSYLYEAGLQKELEEGTI